jgi:tape measure domain-containing protein
MDRASKSADKVSSSLGAVGRSSASAASGLDNVSKKAKSSASRLQVTGKSIVGINNAFGSLTNIIQRSLLIEFLRRTSDELVDVALKWTRYNNTLKFVYESTEKTAAALEFLSSTSERLGVSFESSVEGFAQMAAAAKDSAIEGQGVEDVYLSLVTAGSALGLSQHKLSNAFYAITQMISKGTVQTEELKRQLGDQLPGAMEMAANSMGLTKSAFVSLVESGGLLSDVFLPKFAEYLTNKFTPTAERNASSIVGSFERMGNAWFKFKVNLAKGDVSESMRKSFDEITNILKNPELLNTIKGLVEGFAELVKNILNLIATKPDMVAWAAGLFSALSVLISLAVPISAIVIALVKVKEAMFGIKAAKAVSEIGSVGTSAATAEPAVAGLSSALSGLAATTAIIAGVMAAAGAAGYAIAQFAEKHFGLITNVENYNSVEDARQQKLYQLQARLYDASQAIGKTVSSQDELNKLVAYGVISYDKNTGALKVNSEALKKYNDGTAEATIKGAELGVANGKLVDTYDKIYELTGRVISSKRELNDLVAAGVIKINEETGELSVNAENLAKVKDGTLVVAGAAKALDEAFVGPIQTMRDFAETTAAANVEMGNFSSTSLLSEIEAASHSVKLFFKGISEESQIAKEEYAHFTDSITNIDSLKAYYKAVLDELDIALSNGAITEDKYRQERLALDKAHWSKIVEVAQSSFDGLVAAGKTSGVEYEKALTKLKDAEKKLAEISKTAVEDAHKANKKLIQDIIDSADSTVTSIKASADIAIADLDILYAKGKISKKKYDREIMQSESDMWSEIVEVRKNAVSELEAAGKEGTIEWKNALLDLKDAELEVANEAGSAGTKMSDALSDAEVDALAAKGAWKDLADAIGETAAAAIKASTDMQQARKDAWEGWGEDDITGKKYKNMSADDYFKETIGDPSKMSKEELTNALSKVNKGISDSQGVLDIGGWFKEYRANRLKYRTELSSAITQMNLDDIEAGKKRDEETKKSIEDSAATARESLERESKSAISSISSTANSMISDVRRASHDLATDLKTKLVEGVISKETYDKRMKRSEVSTWKEILAIRKAALKGMRDAGDTSSSNYKDMLSSVKDAELEVKEASIEAGIQISESLNASESAALGAIDGWEQLKTAMNNARDAANAANRAKKGSEDKLEFASGGVVPGSGSGDTVPAMLTPGEIVLPVPVIRSGRILDFLYNLGFKSKAAPGTVQRFAAGGSVKASSFAGVARETTLQNIYRTVNSILSSLRGGGQSSKKSTRSSNASQHSSNAEKSVGRQSRADSLKKAIKISEDQAKYLAKKDKSSDTSSETRMMNKDRIRQSEQYVKKLKAELQSELGNSSSKTSVSRQTKKVDAVSKASKIQEDTKTAAKIIADKAAALNNKLVKDKKSSEAKKPTKSYDQYLLDHYVAHRSHRNVSSLSDAALKKLMDDVTSALKNNPVWAFKHHRDIGIFLQGEFRRWKEELLVKRGKGHRRFSSGGHVPGSGQGDTVPAMLTPGEFVIRKSIVKELGLEWLSKLNRSGLRGYNSGGLVINSLGSELLSRMKTGINLSDISNRRIQHFASGGLVKDSKRDLIELTINGQTKSETGPIGKSLGMMLIDELQTASLGTI